jgi:hypothetical protein
MTSENLSGGLPPELAKLAEQDAGKGVSDQFEDQLTPIITPLQTNSPQCDHRGAEYIDGAAPGKLWLRSSSEPIRDFIDVICCGMVHSFVEWLPARGGYVGRHAELPDDVETTRDGARQVHIRAGNKNVVEEAREFLLLLEGSPHLLSCTSTQHTFARKWQSHFHTVRHPKTGEIMPSFVKRYRLTTVPMANAKGRWFGLTFSEIEGAAGWPSLNEYQQAKALHETIERGLLPGSNVTARIAPPNAA